MGESLNRLVRGGVAPISEPPGAGQCVEKGKGNVILGINKIMVMSRRFLGGGCDLFCFYNRI